MTKSPSIVTKFSKESQLLEPVARFARGRGFRVQTFELPFYEYRIDLYGFSRKNNTTVAIELKLYNWRKALEQSMLYQLCADFVYIAMPQNSAKRVDKLALEPHGVGLIGVRDSGVCNLILLARTHNEVRQPYRSAQINYLKGSYRG